MNARRAGCRETCTSGSEGGLEKPTRWKLGRALRPDPYTEVEVVALDSLEFCAGDTARVYGVDGPSTSEDSTAHLVTAHFCSGGSSAAEQAVFQLDLPAWGRGKCKVVALDPGDSTSVLESNEVTFNGGVEGSYQPLLLSAAQSRASNTISVTAIGTGLDLASEAAIVSRDADWSVTLTPTSRNSTRLVATAEVPASLPPATLKLNSASGCATSVFLSGDVAQAPAVDYSYSKFHDPIVGTRPKDFSFFYDNLGHFHLFFINTIVGKSSLDPVNERYFGHTRGTDLRDDWTSPDTSFHVQGTGWEAAHVWAPTLVQLGPTYYLFYTGVDAQDNQSIGVATTGNINMDPISWNRASAPIVSRGTNATWIDPTGPAQCRDPFVMRAPYDSTRYVMLYTTQYYDEVSQTSKATIGVAHQSSTALTQSWTDDGRLQITDVPNAALSSKAESPHAFIHVNARGDTSYYVCATGNAATPREDRLLRNRRSPWDASADTTADHWNLMTSLYDQLDFAELDSVVFYGFNASEYCRMYTHEYIAGVDATPGVDSTYSIWITMLQWINGGSEPDAMALLDPVTEVKGGSEDEVGPREDGLRLLGRVPGPLPTMLEMSVPRSEHVDLTIYDVLGRTVRELARGTQLPGCWRVAWDGRDESGRVAGSGIYFARMAWPGGARVARVIVLR